jgi:hypothetical protein
LLMLARVEVLTRIEIPRGLITACQSELMSSDGDTLKILELNFSIYLTFSKRFFYWENKV